MADPFHAGWQTRRDLAHRGVAAFVGREHVDRGVFDPAACDGGQGRRDPCDVLMFPSRMPRYMRAFWKLESKSVARFCKCLAYRTLWMNYTMSMPRRVFGLLAVESPCDFVRYLIRSLSVSSVTAR
ncbi:hypothetical protein QFZ97_005623 [Paraburkholderia youngii]